MVNEIAIFRKETGNVRVYVDGDEIFPERVRRVRNLTSGFEMGYMGSGPNLLALGVLVRYLSESRALELYEQFAEEFLVLPEYDASERVVVHVDVVEWAATKGVS